MQAGGSHQIYASWFSSRLKAYPDRLYTLGSNNQVFQGLKEWKNLTTKDSKEGGIEASLFFPFVVDPSSFPKDPTAFAADILKGTLSDPRTKKPVTEELSALLFPGRQNVGAAELADEISALAGPYCGVFYG
ncbi:hypothetical protein AGMMS49579_15790 [Spirochaetia bacterium]|nr:hypothetical protein AGMMS49579_15790 [Spirochaetia bacterium]